MTTEDIDNFPVSEGTVINIKCVFGHQHVSGDLAITCEKGTQFSYNDKPICKPGWASYRFKLYHQ